MSAELGQLQPTLATDPLVGNLRLSRRPGNAFEELLREQTLLCFMSEEITKAGTEPQSAKASAARHQLDVAEIHVDQR